MANFIFNSFRQWFTQPDVNYEFIDPPTLTLEPIKDKEAGPPDEAVAFNRVRNQMARCFDDLDHKQHVWGRKP